MKMISANSPGTRIVETRKARPRTCSRYSRLANNKRLRIGLPSHCLDEDLFERRFHQFKSVDGGNRGSLVQQLLRVAMRLHANLGVARKVLGLGNLRALQEARIAAELHNHPV